MQTASYYNSPIGKILLASNEQGLIGLWLDTDRYYGDNLDKEYSEGGDIAVQAAKDKDHLPIRATGGAIGRNHICIIIPCHRVVGVNHNLTGYGGGIDKKIQLLKLEGVDINQFKEP